MQKERGGGWLGSVTPPWRRSGKLWSVEDQLAYISKVTDLLLTAGSDRREASSTPTSYADMPYISAYSLNL
jgi:hypothetical protein